jgi:hypothetical protein
MHKKIKFRYIVFYLIQIIVILTKSWLITFIFIKKTYY